MSYDLPFEVLRAARKSFFVRFQDGTEAFISNANLLALMRDPKTPTMITLKRDSQGRETKWVLVAKVSWTIGFKPTMFDCCGNPIR